MDIKISKDGEQLAKATVTGAEMVGTDKQVAYAADIRARLIGVLAHHMIVDRGMTVEAVNASIVKMALALATKTDAATWINTYLADELHAYDYTTAIRVLPAIAKGV